MLRTEIFNVIRHKHKALKVFERSLNESRILIGTADADEKKLLRRSPISREILYGNHDHRMLAIGVTKFPP